MDAPQVLIVIFGAAVRADGQPSAALARRIDYGLAAARGDPSAQVLCSGAAGRVGPSEASVMAERLAAGGIARRRLILDEASRDTLQSVVAALRLITRGGYARCVVCSDGYHLPRIRLLLAAVGVPTKGAPIRAGHGGAGWRHFAYMALREAAAIPYDLAIVLVRRSRLLAGTAT